MPTQIFETKQQRALLVQIEAHFLANGWVVERAPLHERIDFRMTKDNLRLSVRCFDGTDLFFRSASETLDIMESDVRTVFTLESRHVIWISNKNPFAFSAEQLVDRKIILLLVDELKILNELASFDKGILNHLDRRKIAILRTSHKASVQIALWMEETGHIELAIEWLRGAAASVPGFSTSRRQLFTLLLRCGRKAEAYAVGKEIFILKPDVENLASDMGRLAKALGFENEIPKWNELASSERKGISYPTTFEALLKKMRG